MPTKIVIHDDVAWGDIIQDANQIDIVVFYYDKWLTRFEQDWKIFFEKGGTARLILSDPELGATADIAIRTFFPNLSAAEFAQKVKRTRELFLSFAQETDGTAQVLYFPQPMHYSFVLVDDTTLYLSVYEQFSVRTGVRVPVQISDLSQDLIMKDYWLPARDLFIQGSVLKN